MVIDGTPAVLQRIDPTNHVRWQLELPDGALPKPSDIGPALVVLASAHGLAVIDLATGKLATVTP